MSICVSLSKAEELYSEGRSKRTSFTYRPRLSDSPESINGNHRFDDYQPKFGDNCFNAPTAQEILDELPSEIEECYLNMRKINNTYGVDYSYLQETIKGTKFAGYKNLSDALADLRMWLKREGVLGTNKQD